MKPYFEQNGAVIYHGDCLEVMRDIPDETIDACVTDPPYGLSFMGKRWDYNVPSVGIFAEIYRVLKPGSRLLCFAGTRTMHRMWVNIEDAGFTIEDSIMWIYGQGFPKHKSKLKPAYEPICVARKGATSALNIEASRIAGITTSNPKTRNATFSGFDTSPQTQTNLPAVKIDGRWPANIVLDEAAGVMLDRQTGILTSGARSGRRNKPKTKTCYGGFAMKDEPPSEADAGGGSRFFYCAKASRAERNAGLGGGARNDHPTVKPLSLMRHLCQLITPADGIILDAFTGSGTTGIAATEVGYRFIGIEREKEYCAIAKARIKASAKPLASRAAA